MFFQVAQVIKKSELHPGVLRDCSGQILRTSLHTMFLFHLEKLWLSFFPLLQIKFSVEFSEEWNSFHCHQNLGGLRQKEVTKGIHIFQVAVLPVACAFYQKKQISR